MNNWYYLKINRLYYVIKNNHVYTYMGKKIRPQSGFKIEEVMALFRPVTLIEIEYYGLPVEFLK